MPLAEPCLTSSLFPLIKYSTSLIWLCFSEPTRGFEPLTSSLPRKRSTPELRRQSQVMSGRRGSNSRPTAWKAVALPAELLPLVHPRLGIGGLCGGRRIRTFEVVRQWIYSPSQLAALVSPLALNS